MWYNERISKHKNSTSLRFNLCCGDGKVELPLLQNPPKYLHRLLFDHNSADGRNYQQNIHTYNMMFAFTFAGIKLDKSINHSRGPPTIRIQGQPCHRIGSLLPMSGKEPKFAQLYIFDTDNEVQNSINAISSNITFSSQHDGIQPQIVSSLGEMLDEHNAHAKSFRMARDRLADSDVDNVRLRLIATREKDGRTYNVPTVSEVAALIVGDFNPNSRRDIFVETQNGQLQRIHELHSSYLGLQFPLFFPYGEDGYRSDILHYATPDSKKRKRNRLTMREWFAYRLQSRPNEAQTLLHSRRLFQQFIAEAYTMVESERLNYIRNNQKKLRVDKYCSLQNSLDVGTSQGLNKGKRVIFPSTFVGSPHYMDQLYFDGMVICSHVGFPNLFITLTCNPNWPEIHRLLAPLNLKAADRPDIISRVFKLKYEEMLSDLSKNHLLGKAVACALSATFTLSARINETLGLIRILVVDLKRANKAALTLSFGFRFSRRSPTLFEVSLVMWFPGSFPFTSYPNFVNINQYTLRVRLIASEPNLRSCLMDEGLTAKAEKIQKLSLSLTQPSSSLLPPPLLPNKAPTFGHHFCSKSRKEGIFGVVKCVSKSGTSKFQIVMAAQLICDRETLEGNTRCRFRGTIRFTATSLVHPDEPARTLQRTVEWILPTPTPYHLVEPVQVIEVTSSEEDPEEDLEELPPELAVETLDFLEGDEDPLLEVDSPEEVMSVSEADSTEDSGPGLMAISGGSSS
ncbi:hypothetical protein GmHk_19G054864 [Glycine max]|nr:hypothetical protein GmHk_19G054864 [Glycine max]